VLLETSVVWPEEKSVMANSEELIGITEIWQYRPGVV
jgi:hypothetical protein